MPNFIPSIQTFSGGSAPRPSYRFAVLPPPLPCLWPEFGKLARPFAKWGLEDFSDSVFELLGTGQASERDGKCIS